MNPQRDQVRSKGCRFRDCCSHQSSHATPSACVAVVVSVAIGMLVASRTFGDELPAKVTYIDHVQPIFRQHCFACHGPDKQKNDLALNSYASAIKGGVSGEVLVATDPDGSYLWQLVNHEAEPNMPPGGGKLSQPELDLIGAWISGGLLERGDSTARKSTRPAVASFAPTTDNRPVGEPAMPQGVLREPVLHASHRGAATALATSPWVPLAAIGAPFQVSFYDLKSCELVGVLPFVEGTPLALRFSRDGSLLLVGGGQQAQVGVAALFDVKSGRRLATVGDELDAVMAADVSVDHSLIAIGGPRKIVRAYRAADGTLAYEIKKHTEWITAIEFSPDGKYLATGDRSGAICLWDATTGRERGELRGHTEQITALSWRDDSAVLASSSEDDTVRLWQPEGQQIKSWNAHGGGVLSVQFAHDGRIVTAGRDQRVKLWKSDGAAERDLAGMEDVALAARFAHDATHVVASDWAGNVRVYPAESGDKFASLDSNPPTLAARLTALQAEVDAARNGAKSTADELDAAEAQLAAAQKALDDARVHFEDAKMRSADADERATDAERRLSAVTDERAAADRAANILADQIAAMQTELTSAESASASVQKARDEAAAAKEKQASAVNDFESQLATLRESLDAARKILDSLAAALDDKQQEQATADSHVDELKSKELDFRRRQAELEAIQKLRDKYVEEK